MKSYQAKKAEIDRKWYLVDASDVPLGRLATKLALILRGKDKPTFTPHVDTGGFVVVVNAGKVRLTGKKLTDKLYYRHSQTPGGLKTTSAREMLTRHPDKLIALAVKGMMPKNRLSKKQLTKLKVYAGMEHPHAAQKPEKLSI
jgi:large subunit ribosomal protein L13